MSRTAKEIDEMLMAKKQEDPDKVEGYAHGLKDGWIHALEWFKNYGLGESDTRNKNIREQKFS